MECREKYWICSSNLKLEEGVHVLHFEHSSVQAVIDRYEA